ISGTSSSVQRVMIRFSSARFGWRRRAIRAALYQSSTSTTNPPSVIVLLALLVPHLKKRVSAVAAVVSIVVVPLTMSGAWTASTRAEVVGTKTEPVPSTVPLVPVLRQVKTASKLHRSFTAPDTGSVTADVPTM